MVPCARQVTRLSGQDGQNVLADPEGAHMRRIVPLALAAAALMLGTPADAAPAGCGDYRDPRVSLNGSSSFVDTRRPGKVWLGGSTWWSNCPIGGIPVTLLQSTGGAFSPIATTTSRADGTYGFPGRAVPRTTDFMVTTSSTNGTPGTKSQIWHVSVSANPRWTESCGNTSFLPPFSAFPELELELDVTDTSVDWGKPVPATLTLTNVSDIVIERLPPLDAFYVLAQLLHQRQNSGAKNTARVPECSRITRCSSGARRTFNGSRAAPACGTP